MAKKAIEFFVWMHRWFIQDLEENNYDLITETEIHDDYVKIDCRTVYNTYSRIMEDLRGFLDCYSEEGINLDDAYRPNPRTVLGKCYEVGKSLKIFEDLGLLQKGGNRSMDKNGDPEADLIYLEVKYHMNDEDSGKFLSAFSREEKNNLLASLDADSDLWKYNPGLAFRFARAERDCKSYLDQSFYSEVSKIRNVKELESPF